MLKRRFYGPRHRWMLISGFIRPYVWIRMYGAWGRNFNGNLRGEGRLLGGVFILGAGDEGILLEHREAEIGNYASIPKILETVENMRRA